MPFVGGNTNFVFTQIQTRSDSKFTGGQCRFNGGVSSPSSVRWCYCNTESLSDIVTLLVTVLFFSLVFQHSRGFLFPLRQLNGNRLGNFCASVGVFPQNVFWFCCPGNPHWTHLSSCIQPLCVFMWINFPVLTLILTAFTFLNSLTSFLNTLTWGRHLHWSLAWWSSLRTFPMAWQRASNCLVGVHLHLTDKNCTCVIEALGFFFTMLTSTSHLFFSTYRNYVHPVCRNCDVPLHPSQLVSCHADPHAADPAHHGLHVWSVNSLLSTQFPVCFDVTWGVLNTIV